MRVAIVGYGNLGRGVEIALQQNSDMQLVSVFTRRDPAQVETVHGDVRSVNDLEAARDDIDVAILCGGSRLDLPEQSPQLASWFSIVDSFDTHARIPEHFGAVDAAAQEARTTAIISTGWDPGLFSLNRLMGEAILPHGETYTFWGKGLSQGHSDALRRVPGVAAGVQYTIPSEAAIDSVRAGLQPDLTTREKHTRECYVVLEDGADEAEVRESIVTMPDYYAPYETIVHFVTREDFDRDHIGMPHGGFVIRSAETSPRTKHVIEYRLALESNPEFTASVLVAYARAAVRLNRTAQYGAKTIFDVPPGLLSSKSPEQLRAELL